MKLRILVFVLILAITSSAVNAATFEEDVLKSLNFIDTQNTEFVTRGEIAQIISRMINMHDSPSTNNVTFADLPDTHKYYNSIILAAQLGILSADSSNKIFPDEPITYQQAVKIVLCALGYREYAELKGGWPVGYMSVAQEKGIDKGINSVGQWISRENVYRLLYNSLEVGILEETVKNGMTSYDTRNTFLYTYHKISRAYGQIKATHSVKLIEANIGNGKVLIDNNVYNSEIDLDSLVGYEIEFYIKHSDSGEKEILSAFPRRNRNDTLVLMTDDILKCNDYKIYYEDEEKINTASYSINTHILYNNYPVERFDENDFIGKCGSLRFIDTNIDGIYDVIFIDVSYDIVVKTVDRTNGIIYDKYDSSLQLKVDYNRGNFKFIDEFGEKMYIEELTEYDVLTVFQSKNCENTIIYYSNSEVEGEILEVETLFDYAILNIGGEKYKTTKKLYSITDIKVGDIGTFKINHDKKIAAYRVGTSETKKFGIFLEHEAPKGVNNIHKIKIFSQDNSMKILNLAKHIEFDGKQTDAKDWAAALTPGSLIVYNTNSKGEIIYIDTVEKTKDEDNNNTLDKYWDSASELKYLRSASSLGYKILVNSSTVVFKIPKNIISAHDDDYGAYGIEFLRNGQSYAVTAYRTDIQKYSASALVLQVDTEKPSIYPTAPICVVSDIRYAINNSGEESCKISGFVNGKSVNLYTKNKSIADSIHVGDIIRYDTNDKGDINLVSVVYEFETGKVHLNMPSSTDISANFRFSGGRVYSKDGGNIMVTQEEMSQTVAMDKLEAHTATLFPICVYDSAKRNKVFMGSAGDILDYKTDGVGSKVFIYTANGSPGMMYVIK